MKFGTKTIHAGQEADPTTGAIMTPIYQTSTYIQASPGDHKGYEYSRTGNPTRNALEKNLAALENGTHGLCFGSGLAAIDAIIKLLSAIIELGHELAGIAPLHPTSNSVIVVAKTAIYEWFFIRCLNPDIISSFYPLPIRKFIVSV